MKYNRKSACGRKLAAIYNTNTQIFFGTGNSLASCKSKCTADTNCTAVFGALGFGDGSCWTCPNCRKGACPSLAVHPNTYHVHYRPHGNQMGRLLVRLVRNTAMVAETWKLFPADACSPIPDFEGGEVCAPHSWTLVEVDVTSDEPIVYEAQLQTV